MKFQNFVLLHLIHFCLGNLALSDEANELIFKSVHKFIRRSKRFEHTE